MDWTKGKGVIGRCWSEHKTMFKDLKAIATAHGTCDQACFSTLGDDVTMGLTFAEFRTIIGKYSSVLAFPITHAGTFIGCIAVDLPLGEGTRTSLDHRTVKEIVGITAASVGNLLRPPS